MKLTAPDTQRIEYLDAIRGLAALSVAVGHYIRTFGFPTDSRLTVHMLTFTPLHIFWDGAAAVSMFFVLSGFVLSRKYIARGFYPADYVPFFVRRVFRLYPAYLAMVAISYVGFAHFDMRDLLAPYADMEWLLSLWSGKPSWIQELNLFRDGTYFYVPQAWTLGIEMILSLLVPLLVIATAPSSLVGAIFVLLFVLSFGMPIYVFHFFVGVCMSKYQDRISDFFDRLPAMAKPALLLAGAFLYSYEYTFRAYLKLPRDSDVIFLFSGIGSSILLCCAMGSRRIQYVLTIDFIALIGRVSYSVYLVHGVLMFCVVPGLFVTGIRCGLSLVATWSITFVIYMVLTVVASYAMYQLVERPGMNLGKWVSGRLGQAGRRAADSPST